VRSIDLAGVFREPEGVSLCNEVLSTGKPGAGCVAIQRQELANIDESNPIKRRWN
jgi:hypothetical protein